MSTYSGASGSSASKKPMGQIGQTGQQQQLVDKTDRARKQTASKDDQTRRKLEREFSRTSTTTATKSQTTSASASASASSAASIKGQAAPVAQGAVSKLKPSPPITITENNTILVAAKLMSSKRSDCLLIVRDERDDDGNTSTVLAGILTDKDIAFRVVAQNLNPIETTVAQVMTPNPTSVTSSTEGNDALLRMAQGRFRHLPVVDGDSIVGVLDIIKCLYDSISRLEKAYESAKALYEAMQAANSHWNTLETESVLENLRQRMNCPPVSAVCDTDLPPPVVSPRSSVREAARLMKQEHASAVLVVDNEKIVGIFTSKDIVLRVIGNGLDPDVTSIIRVMTPHPTTVSPQSTVLEALKMMQQGRYLHLPVVNDDQSVFGLVDVLLLTYSTIGQVDTIERSSTTKKQEPAWRTFWNASLAAEEETKSPVIIGKPSASSDYSAGDQQAPLDENFESISMASGGGLEDETMGSFVFKIKGPDGTVHRFSSKNGDFKGLKENVARKVGEDVGSLPILKYEDEEGDLVALSNDEDVFDAVNLARTLGWKRIQLHLGNDADSDDQKEEVKPSSKVAKGKEKKNPPPQEPQKQVVQTPPQQEPQVKPAVISSPAPAPQPPAQRAKETEYVQIHPNYIIAGLGVALVLVLIYAIRK